jgi:phenylalanyl-tRNA synthetase alpha chain
MDLQELKTRLDALAEAAAKDFQDAHREDDLIQARNLYLGRKGHIKTLGSDLRDLPADQRPLVGQELNRARELVEAAADARLAVLRDQERERRLREGRVDVTLPPRGAALSQGHPLMQIEAELISIFRKMGFDVAQGPELETDYHNFEALNFPADHPARDMQDTILIDTLAGRRDLLCRTHTSPVQIRTMLKYKPPVRIIAPGVVYRHDDDATHSPVFRQIECLHVDKNVTLANLKGTLLHFVRELFGPDTRIRLRPSFFPFTEPSAEVDVSCVFCGGHGCRLCKHSGWIEILGSGMVDPNVYAACGYDPGEVTGYAFGLGVERVAMLLLQVPEIRLFYENDVRFLEQF